MFDVSICNKKYVLFCLSEDVSFFETIKTLGNRSFCYCNFLFLFSFVLRAAFRFYSRFSIIIIINKSER